MCTGGLTIGGGVTGETGGGASGGNGGSGGDTGGTTDGGLDTGGVCGGLVAGGVVAGGFWPGGTVEGGEAGGLVTGGLVVPGEGAGPAPAAPVNCPEPSGGRRIPLSWVEVTAELAARVLVFAAVTGFLPTGKATALCSASRSLPVSWILEASRSGLSLSACNTPVSRAAHRTSSATRSNAIIQWGQLSGLTLSRGNSIAASR
jgi:hypothetical protein